MALGFDWIVSKRCKRIFTVEGEQIWVTVPPETFYFIANDTETSTLNVCTVPAVIYTPSLVKTIHTSRYTDETRQAVYDETVAYVNRLIEDKGTAWLDKALNAHRAMSWFLNQSYD